MKIIPREEAGGGNGLVRDMNGYRKGHRASDVSEKGFREGYLLEN